MIVKHGDGRTQFGPGVNIELTGDEVATAIDAWLVAHGVHVSGPRTVTVNGGLCQSGLARISCLVYVDPSGFVIYDGVKFLGRGGAETAPDPVKLTDIECFARQYSIYVEEIYDETGYSLVGNRAYTDTSNKDYARKLVEVRGGRITNAAELSDLLRRLGEAIADRTESQR